MDQQDLNVLSGFEEVWERVQTGGSRGQRDASGELKQPMEQMYSLWDGLRQLADRTVGWQRRRLLMLAERIRKRFARWQLRYFLETGDVYDARSSFRFASYTPYNLRKLWQSAMESEEKLRNSHLKADETFVAEVEALQEEFLLQAKALEELLAQLLQ